MFKPSDGMRPGPAGRNCMRQHNAQRSRGMRTNYAEEPDAHAQCNDHRCNEAFVLRNAAVRETMRVSRIFLQDGEIHMHHSRV
eukprot:6302902-Pyramimonas_sp.AAC.1